MADFDNTNRLLMVKNDKKGNEKAPDFRISININGEDFVSGVYMNQSDKFITDINPKGTYMSGKVEPKRVNSEAKPVSKADPMDDLDSEIPF